MNVANHCKEKVRTERQWNKLGFKPLEGVSGERMWTNQFCGQIATYYREDDVEKMTTEEFEYWKDNDRKQKNERAKELRKARIEKQKQLEEKWKQEELAWQKWKDDCKQKIEELEQTQNLLAMVNIESYGLYIYEVPKGTEVGRNGIFPFGFSNEPIKGEVQRFVKPEEITQEKWFPYGLKKGVFN